MHSNSTFVSGTVSVSEIVILQIKKVFETKLKIQFYS